MLKVSLTREEGRVVRAIAQLKTDNNIAANTKTSWDRGKDPYEPDLQGYGAEVAFCKAANLFVDLSSNNRKGGIDCTLPDKTTVDVKWTSRPQHELFVKANRKKLGDAQVYVLLGGRFPDYEVIGFATEEEVFAAPVIKATYAENYTLYEHQLHDPKELERYGVNYGTI